MTEGGRRERQAGPEWADLMTAPLMPNHFCSFARLLALLECLVGHPRLPTSALCGIPGRVSGNSRAKQEPPDQMVRGALCEGRWTADHSHGTSHETALGPAQWPDPSNWCRSTGGQPSMLHPPASAVLLTTFSGSFKLAQPRSSPVRGGLSLFNVMNSACFPADAYAIMSA